MATGNAKKFGELGVPIPLAIEFAKQITASTGNKRRLIELGVNPIQATGLIVSVVSHTMSKAQKNALAETGMTPRVITEFARQIAT